MARHDRRHRPEDEPFDCALASLEELAHARLDDRQAVLEHGRRALYALQRALDEARDEGIGWRDHAEEYARLLLELAGMTPADPRQVDALVAAAVLRQLLAERAAALRQVDALTEQLAQCRDTLADAEAHRDTCAGLLRGLAGRAGEGSDDRFGDPDAAAERVRQDLQAAVDVATRMRAERGEARRLAVRLWGYLDEEAKDAVAADLTDAVEAWITGELERRRRSGGPGTEA